MTYIHLPDIQILFTRQIYENQPKNVTVNIVHTQKLVSGNKYYAT